jgi:hypothetical protein
MLSQLTLLFGVLCAVLGASAKANTTYLFDLNTDPYESADLTDHSDYSEIKAELFDMISTWQASAFSCDNFEIDGDSLTAIYEECGGVCPNVTSDFYERDIQQIYSATSPPNIVFILADDWGYNDVGFRSTYMDWTTPTIDSYVKQGIKLENYFTHYYCTPSRGAFITGRYASRLGLFDDGDGCELPLSENTIGQEMQSAGYKTYMVGKWNLG